MMGQKVMAGSVGAAVVWMVAPSQVVPVLVEDVGVKRGGDGKVMVMVIRLGQGGGGGR